MGEQICMARWAQLVQVQNMFTQRALPRPLLSYIHLPRNDIAEALIQAVC